jgi:RNA polymerase sigma-70 factor (ECF subfamily)
MDAATPSGTSPTLLRRLRDTPRNSDAWAAFARRYGPAVYRWCRQWGLQTADADDVTQSVLLALVERMRTFEYDPGGRFRAWLKTVAYHAWAKFVGGRARREQVGGGDAQDRLAAAEAREDLATRLEAEYDRELADWAMVRVAARVEPHTWEAFRLTALDGLSGAEAAARLGMKVATVYVARSKVQRMIQEEVAAADAAPA